MRRLTGAFLTMIALGVLAEARQQTIDPDAIFRIYLKSGQALPAYGESALGRRPSGLHSAAWRLPNTDIAAVDEPALPPTSIWTARGRYANTIRAKHYAATRGELDYAAMSQEVQRTLGQLPAVQDPKEAPGDGARSKETADELGRGHLWIPGRGRPRAHEPLR
jgi:hypothetical protein